MLLLGSSKFSFSSMGSLPSIRFYGKLTLILITDNKCEEQRFLARKPYDYCCSVYGGDRLLSSVKGASLSLATPRGEFQLLVDPSLQNYEIGFISKMNFGLVFGNDYAFISMDGDTLLKKYMTESVSTVLGFDKDSHYLRIKTKVFCLDNVSSHIIWETTIDERAEFGSLKQSLPINSHGNLFIAYYDEHANRLIIGLSAKDGKVFSKTPISNTLSSGDFIELDSEIFFSDDDYLWCISAKSGDVIRKGDIPKLGEKRGIAYVDDLVVVLFKEKATIAVFERSTFTLCYTHEFSGEDKIGAALDGTEVGIAVRMEGSGAILFEPSWGRYVTVEQLRSGSIPYEEVEALAIDIEQRSTEKGRYNLWLKLHPGLNYADLVRHASHGLLEVGYKHATFVDFFDPSDGRLGDPNFDGLLTIDLSEYKNLSEFEEKALNGVLQESIGLMSGNEYGDGCLWVHCLTEEERSIKIEVFR